METTRPSRTPRLTPRLSVLAVAAFCAAHVQAGTPAKGAADPGAAEIGAYRLSAAALHKVEKAIKGFEAMVGANPALGEKIERLELTDPEDGSPLILDKAVAQIASIPEFKKALASAGMTPREYVVFSFALLGATLAEYGLSQGGTLSSDSPPALAENVKWLKANRAELERFQREMDKLSAKYEEPEEPEEQDSEENEEDEPESEPGR
jgi:hypothetical protein